MERSFHKKGSNGIIKHEAEDVIIVQEYNSETLTFLIQFNDLVSCSYLCE
jgi:hypothetical protein